MLAAVACRILAGAGLTAGALLGAAPDAAAQAESPPPGAIAGRITDRQTGRPIPTAQVFLVGTSHGVQVGDDGRYRILEVRPGPVQL
ncbi:MAG: carboxypeptidase regulatory-like domain-containing protein, partial [Thermoleophilaceae bacterium]